MVLANDRLALDSELFPTNLLNKPLFIVNGGQDPLYPMRAVEPFIDHLKTSGVASITIRSPTRDTTRRGGRR